MKLLSRRSSGPSDKNPETRGQVVLAARFGRQSRKPRIEALPRILIRELQARGFKFVPVSTLGGWTRDQVMPQLPPSESLFTRTDTDCVSGALRNWRWLLQWAFIIGIVLGLARLASDWRAGFGAVGPFAPPRTRTCW